VNYCLLWLQDERALRRSQWSQGSAQSSQTTGLQLSDGNSTDCVACGDGLQNRVQHDTNTWHNWVSRCDKMTVKSKWHRHLSHQEIQMRNTTKRWILSYC